MRILSLKNVTKRYNGKTVFSHIDLDIDEGDFILIKGESGAGKTTLLNIISGFETVDDGNLVYYENNTKVPTGYVADNIGYIYQDLYIHPRLNVCDNISLVGYIHNMKNKDLKQRTMELSNELGLNEILDQKISEISGGQLERVCIARALFMNPKIIIADEPTNNLDRDNSKKILDILYNIGKTKNAAIILASHDILAESYADKILLMHGDS